MQKRILTAVLVLAMLMAGCGRTEMEEPEEKETVDFTSMEEEADISYEVPVNTPGILADQLGYTTKGSKVILLKGAELPDEFYVIDSESGKKVYTGYLKEQKYDEKRSEYNGYGDFSSLDIPGTYYIEAPVLGRSYSFEIGENVYEKVFEQACKQYYFSRCGMTLTSEYAGENAHNACHTGKSVLRDDISVGMDVTGGWHQNEKGQKDVVAAAKAMSVIMLAYELYGNSFSDNMGIPESGNGIPDLLDEVRYEAEWLLKMQDAATGAVYSGVTVYPQSGNLPVIGFDSYVEPPSPEAEKAFAMAIAKFSFLYQNYDAEYATTCLQAADRAFKYAELDKTNKRDELGFAAAAELYRAAGQITCQKYVNEYLQEEDFKEEEDEVTLIGCITYISTKQAVDIELCEKIMEMLSDKTENTIMEADTSFYKTGELKEQENQNKLLLKMVYLAVMNHINSGQEYKTIIENYLHCFGGRNERALCYIEGFGENNCEHIEGAPGIMKQFESNAKLIFVLSEVMEKI